VQRAVLHAALWGAFAASGATIETNRRAVGVETGADGLACLRFESGGRSPSFDLIVDASGARSSLRAAVTSRPPRAFAYGAVWTSALDRDLSPRALTQRYIAARAMIGLLPLGRASAEAPSLAAFFWSIKPEGFSAWRAGFDHWRSEVARLWPALEPMVAGFAGPGDFTLARYAHFSLRRPFRGPLALIGDAAHATSPQLGQGANNAMLDALALADALGRVRDIGQALATFAEFRRRHVRFYQSASALLTPFFQSDSKLLPLIRDAAFDRLKVVPYLKREMLRTLAGIKTGLFASAAPEALASLGQARLVAPLTGPAGAANVGP
ncbi:MAG TPA: NAD(P)/FAD-dependent oxidoreductase, partial [Roseiarcus sp.]|nr:NAD(P)/FAD-dependent oxidoreductase [Roseiarcus sp.]